MAISDYLSHPSPHPVRDYPADCEISLSPAESGDVLRRGLEEAEACCAAGKKVVLRLAPGEYRTSGLRIGSSLSGSTLVSERGPRGERAVLNGGLSIPAKDFHPLSPAIAARLHGEAAKKVLCADLKAYGLGPEDWGVICPVGGFSTADKYDDAPSGVTSEVFFNSFRMTPARYPNKGQYSRLEAVADVGDCWEYPPQVYFYDWNHRRNHRGGSYVLTEPDAARVAGWESREDIWAFGYFFHDWADCSTPVTFDPEHRRMFPRYVSRYGAKAGAEFYLFNIFEELDEPGEYYLDRKNGLLYIYPLGDMQGAKIELSLTESPAVFIEGASHITLDGLIICNTRENGITAAGDDLTIRDCQVTNVANHGISIVGSRNTVENCEISHTGRGGVILEGGDRETLTPGNSQVINCSIHDFAEIYQTYAGGIHLNGVGNRAAHNEIYNTPHTAIFYDGNDQLVEYNYLHDVVLHSRDAGAIYAGLDWAARGSVVRYNVLERVGTEDMKPQGIYWDDGLSGQTAYGNLLVGIGDNAIEFGGGAYGKVTHNIIIDCGTPLHYDDRDRDGLLHKGWAHEAVDNRKGRCWVSLTRWPIHSAVWEEHYPELKLLREEPENPALWEDPDFPTNPAGSTVSCNVIIGKGEIKNDIAPSVYRYSKVENNIEFSSLGEPGFVDPEKGDFRLKDDAPLRRAIPDFPDIPYEKIGRY